jgi:hypothetical protein
MSKCFKSGGLLIAASDGWLDVTSEIETDSPPFTLTKEDGVGAIQFSVAKYEHGSLPQITMTNVRELLADFALSRELGHGFDLVERESPLLTCARSFNYDGSFLRAWYCSDGRNVVLVTYVCERGSENIELKDCEQMVADLRFEG